MGWMHPAPTAAAILADRRTPTEAQLQREQALRAALMKKGKEGKRGKSE